jgi:hypothetical protein
MRLDLWLRAQPALAPYSKGFCHEKQENMTLLQMHVCPSVIPARFWPESRDALDWIPARGMPE